MKWLKKYWLAIVTLSFVTFCFVWIGLRVVIEPRIRNEFQKECVRLVTEGRKIKGKVVGFIPYRVSKANRFRIRGSEGINVVIEYGSGLDNKKKIYETWELSEKLKDEYHEGSSIDLYYLEDNPHLKVSSPLNIELRQALKTILNLRHLSLEQSRT